jgi:hypothetical protein
LALSSAAIHNCIPLEEVTLPCHLPLEWASSFRARHDASAACLVTLKCNGGHVWMNAEMFVAPHPYYAVTDVSGRFELTDVPPGQYEIVAWHGGWSVARQESTFDVLTEKRVQRPIFGDPKIMQKSVTIRPTETVVVNFTLSEKWRSYSQGPVRQGAVPTGPHIHAL